MPIPIDPACDPRSLAIERVTDELNLNRLTVAGLKEGRYRLWAAVESGELVELGIRSKDELAAGVDLNGLAEFPTNRQASDLLTRLREDHQKSYREWRDTLAKGIVPKVVWLERKELREMAKPLGVKVKIERMMGE